MNAADLAARGLQHGDVVDVETLCTEEEEPRMLSGLTAVAFDIAAGSVAAYYPEANNLIAIDNYDRQKRHAVLQVGTRVREAQRRRRSEPACIGGGCRTGTEQRALCQTATPSSAPKISIVASR